jgi:hypothetical protein
MARNTSSSCSQCRREGKKLFLKASKCNTDKCIFSNQYNSISNNKNDIDKTNLNK